MNIANGTTCTTRQRPLSGAGLSHRKYDARQKACVAVEVRKGHKSIDLSRKQLSSVFGVSVTYILAAEKLSPEKRAAVIAGNDTTSFTALLNPPPLALPVPVDAIKQLFENVRTVGIDRALDIVAAVEAAE